MGVAIQFHEGPQDEESSNSEEITTTVSESGPPGAELVMDTGEEQAPEGQDKAQPFSTEEEMAEAYGKTDEDGSLLIDSDAEYLKELEGRTVESVTIGGPWDDEIEFGKTDVAPKPTNPAGDMFRGVKSVMIEIPEEDAAYHE